MTDIITENSVIITAMRQADNLRGIYGKDCRLTLYVHSYGALARLLEVEGFKALPFKCAVIPDSTRVPDPVGVQLALERSTS